MVTFKQHETSYIFKFLNSLRYGRLGNIQGTCRLSDTPVLGDGSKIHALTQSETNHISPIPS